MDSKAVVVEDLGAVVDPEAVEVVGEQRHVPRPGPARPILAEPGPTLAEPGPTLACLAADAPMPVGPMSAAPM
jgi:hypothetical protein